MTLTPSERATRTPQRQQRSQRHLTPCECVSALERPLRRSPWRPWLCECAQHQRRQPQLSRRPPQHSRSTRYTLRLLQRHRCPQAASGCAQVAFRLPPLWHSQATPSKSGSRSRQTQKYGLTRAARLASGHQRAMLAGLGRRRAAPLAHGRPLLRAAKHGKMRLKLSAL